jgi:hypothetical protein
MKQYQVLVVTLLFAFVPLLVHSESKTAQREAGIKWLSVKPLAVSTTSYESPNKIHCYIGLAYEINGTRDVGVAMAVHCANIVAVAALIDAEITDGDTEEIKISLNPITSGDYESISHILINRIDYKLAE